jgi:hypothetical protein
MDGREYGSHDFTEVELEVLRRLLEHQEPKSIRNDLDLSANDLDTMLAHPRFQREYELQTKIADRGIRVRMERLAGEALDVVRDVMRTAVSPGNRLRAAVEILDRSGYVKIEKRLTVTADAESIIRELNRLGSADANVPVAISPEKVIKDEVPAAPPEEFTDVDFTEIAAAVAEGDFGSDS